MYKIYEIFERFISDNTTSAWVYSFQSTIFFYFHLSSISGQYFLL